MQAMQRLNPYEPPQSLEGETLPQSDRETPRLDHVGSRPHWLIASSIIGVGMGWFLLAPFCHGPPGDVGAHRTGGFLGGLIGLGAGIIAVVLVPRK